MASGPRTGREYVLAVLVIGLTLLLGLALRSRLRSIDVAMVLLLGVVVAGGLTRFGPALLSAILATTAFDFFFVPPAGSLAAEDRAYVPTLAVMLIVASLMGGLTARIRMVAEAAREQERRVRELHALSIDLARETEMDRVIAVAQGHLGRAVGAEAELVLGRGVQPKPSQYRRYIIRAPIWQDWPEAGLAIVCLDSESRVPTEEERKIVRLHLDQISAALERVGGSPTPAS